MNFTPATMDREDSYRAGHNGSGRGRHARPADENSDGRGRPVRPSRTRRYPQLTGCCKPSNKLATCPFGLLIHVGRYRRFNARSPIQHTTLFRSPGPESGGMGSLCEKSTH
jgi:hypothetical protein